MAVLVVATIAIILSLNPNDTILGIVGYAWAGFGSAFGPVILLSLHWKRMNKWGALAGMVVGAVTVVIWSNVIVLSESLYEMIPGFFLSVVAVVVVSLLTGKPSKDMEKTYMQMEEIIKDNK